MRRPPQAAQRWVKPLGNLFERRGNAYHFREEAKETEPHPTIPTNVSAESATYTPENATASLDLLVEIVNTVVASPSAALQK